MLEPPLPDNESARLQELQRLAILDTESEASFDDISEIARHLAGAETGIISLVDSNRQWFKSCVGIALAQSESPRSISFCGHTILQPHPLIINDALKDERFADNPLVTGDPKIRFYAGFPLITSAGHALGSLCVISREPHALNQTQIDDLRRLAALTVQHLSHLRASSLQLLDRGGLRSEALIPVAREGLRYLERLISRDQMLQRLDLILAMETGSGFVLLRCRYRDYERVNATLGGLVAEEFINEAARRLIAALPKEASLARFSDAELLVLLPYATDEQAVRRLAERIIAFSNQIYRNGQQSLLMSVSIGIAFHRNNYESLEAILADTSMAVQMARRSSGSSFRFIDSDSRVMARESYRLESDLRDAIQAKQLVAYLQPIIDLASAEPIGFEALARWPRGSEVLAPGSFLPMLAENGITAELDLLIIEKALAAMPLLAQPVPQRQMSVSVNISGLLLEDAELRRRLLSLIDDNPCPPGWTLQVEIVEDAFQDTSDEFELFINDLVRRQVIIAIDDFGTGYSSLARLISLPIQMVKIDRAFVQKVDSGAESARTLLRTMISMLKDLGLNITAEGVETPAQREWLLRHDVSKAQGFLFHRPMPVTEAISLLQALNYRPRALPVDPRRLQAVRRRRQRASFWRLPFVDRRRRDGYG